MTLRSSDTVHPITHNSHSLFSFKKQKQEYPLQFIKEVEMLQDTEERKELSTLTEVEGETAKDKMIRHTQGKPIRQPTQRISVLRLLCHLKF